MMYQEFDQILERIAIEEVKQFRKNLIDSDKKIVSNEEMSAFIFMKAIESSARMTAKILESTGLIHLE